MGGQNLTLVAYKEWFSRKLRDVGVYNGHLSNDVFNNALSVIWISTKGPYTAHNYGGYSGKSFEGNLVYWNIIDGTIELHNGIKILRIVERAPNKNDNDSYYVRIEVNACYVIENKSIVKKYLRSPNLSKDDLVKKLRGIINDFESL